MIINVVLEKEDFAVIHDIVFDIMGYDASDEQCQLIWDALDEDLQDDAIRWGLNDTPTRENIYAHMKEQYEKSLKEQ